MLANVIIVKNPFFYEYLAPEAHRRLMKDGSWIPLVFGAIEGVVERHYFELCELDWDYCRDVESVPAEYERFKSVFALSLNEAGRALVERVADEIETEIRANAEAALENARESEEE
ncbi:MAG: hypothetical protein HUK22_00420 [Thermoguttaceae bacterium]|nr:hypothetical protein [Thermoguttaceae bacterium]